ncbi:hypothetical protein N431DRAFT_558597 [Stipitochalara longipes BDJ]|nr:hypothetical protein N431DRAFT_558597 [Stipitochalara longipes BDJ]
MSAINEPGVEPPLFLYTQLDRSDRKIRFLRLQGAQNPAQPIERYISIIFSNNMPQKGPEQREEDHNFPRGKISKVWAHRRKYQNQENEGVPARFLQAPILGPHPAPHNDRQYNAITAFIADANSSYKIIRFRDPRPIPDQHFQGNRSLPRNSCSPALDFHVHPSAGPPVDVT